MCYGVRGGYCQPPASDVALFFSEVYCSGAYRWCGEGVTFERLEVMRMLG
jgi:hypothetical protein